MIMFNKPNVQVNPFFTTITGNLLNYKGNSHSITSLSFHVLMHHSHTVTLKCRMSSRKSNKEVITQFSNPTVYTRNATSRFIVCIHLNILLTAL